MLEEGFVVNKPPMFKGANYDYWKERMIAFFEFIHIDMCDVIERDNCIPLNAKKKEIPREKWTNYHKSRFLLQLTRKKHLVMCSITRTIFQSS